jgi:SAM-dependent methyltransferase
MSAIAERDERIARTALSGLIPTQGALSELVGEMNPDWHSNWAWANYEELVLRLSRRFGLSALCEIGGGRDPGFLPTNPALRGLSLTVNDIDQHELDCAPDGLAKACFNIAGDLGEADARPGSFDLMFSRMVFEHVDGVERAWNNIHTLLKPGGVALAFFPTLYAPVFTINRMIPERLSRALVHALYPARRDGGSDPKFPALYDHCVSSERKLRPMLEKAGFSDIHVQPFWGHGYFKRMPLIREADDLFNRWAARIDWRLMSTHAFVLVRKAG